MGNNSELVGNSNMKLANEQINAKGYLSILSQHLVSSIDQQERRIEFQHD